MNHTRKLLCCLLGLAIAAFALPASATALPKQYYSLQMSVPPGQAPPPGQPFTVQAKITNESILPFQSFNLFVSGVTIVGVNNNELDTFALLPKLSLPLPPFAKVAFKGSSISITKDPMLWGETLTLSIQVNTCGDAQWSAAVWTGLDLSGLNFTLDLANSNLTASIPCGPPVAAGAMFTVPNSVSQECVSGQRGFYDQDGGVRGNLQFFVTNNVFSTDQLHFRWPDDANTGGDPFAAFEYDICAPGSTPPAISTIQVAWLNDQGGSASTGNPVFVQAQECNDYANFLPAPYGVLVGGLAAANEGDPAVITVNSLATLGPFSGQGPFGPGQENGTIDRPTVACAAQGVAGTVPYFDIVIGNERMRVTDACSDDEPGGDVSDPADVNGSEGYEVETWTVTRGVGHTTDPATPGMTDGHSSNALVMSTPKPLLPTDVTLPYPYVAGAPALMCVATQNPDDPPSMNSHTTTFIDDGGDGWGSHP